MTLFSLEKPHLSSNVNVSDLPMDVQEVFTLNAASVFQGGNGWLLGSLASRWTAV